MFDEQPDGDPHGECAAEIHRLEKLLQRIQQEAQRADPPASFGDARGVIRRILNICAERTRGVKGDQHG